MPRRRLPNYLDQNPAVVRLERRRALILQREMTRLDHRQRECLAYGIDIFDVGRVERQRVASYLGVGPYVVSRWSSLGIMPRDADYRQSKLAGMQRLMADIVADYNARLKKLKGWRPTRPTRPVNTRVLTP